VPQGSQQQQPPHGLQQQQQQHPHGLQQLQQQQPPHGLPQQQQPPGGARENDDAADAGISFTASSSAAVEARSGIYTPKNSKLTSSSSSSSCSSSKLMTAQEFGRRDRAAVRRILQSWRPDTPPRLEWAVEVRALPIQFKRALDSGRADMLNLSPTGDGCGSPTVPQAKRLIV
jgi:hypothetical protein